MLKPGVRTTEFWLTVAVDAAALVGDLAKVVPDRYATVMGALATGLYALSRGWAKSGPLPRP